MKYQRLKRNVGRSFSSLPTLHLSSSTSGQFVERVYLPFKTRIVLWWRVVLQKQRCACLILSASVCWKNKPGEKKIRMRRLAVTWSFGSPRSFQFWHFRHERPRTTRPSRHDDPESRSFQEKLWDAGCTSACKEGRCGNEDIIKVRSDKIAPVDQLGADIYLQRPFEPASPAKHRSRSVKQRDKTHSLSTWPEKWR